MNKTMTVTGAKAFPRLVTLFDESELKVCMAVDMYGNSHNFEPYVNTMEEKKLIFIEGLDETKVPFKATYLVEEEILTIVDNLGEN